MVRCTSPEWAVKDHAIIGDTPVAGVRLYGKVIVDNATWGKISIEVKFVVRVRPERIISHAAFF